MRQNILASALLVLVPVLGASGCGGIIEGGAGDPGEMPGSSDPGAPMGPATSPDPGSPGTPNVPDTLPLPADSHPARLYLSAPVLRHLLNRAAANDPAWVALRKRCDALAGGNVYPPKGTAYPNFPDIGPGYQGEDYLPEIMNLGLCYRVVRGTDAAAEMRFGAAGARLLLAMSTPVASGGQPPSTDDGYGIRNYGVGMATGFDWLYPALSTVQKQQVVATLNGWVDWYDKSGFSRTAPIGNYFAGYLLAKTTTALATEGDNPNAAGYFADVRDHLWTQLVLPAYSKSMAGGGWPEGWEYGPRAVRSMAEVLWAVKTAKGLDWSTQVPLARDQAAYQTYFAWPSLNHMDDQGTIHSGSPIQPSCQVNTALSMILEYAGDPAAATARSFAADIMARSAGTMEHWQRFLYWDDALPRSPYSARPLSYLASGPGQVAVRSSWLGDAVWGSLTGGAYIDSPDSGEQSFNQGSLTVVKGDQPILVNASGWLPQVAGTPGEDYVYNDSWGARTRKLSNSFFVNDAGNVYNPGQGSVGPDSSRAHMERYEDRAGYVRARAARIEDMYLAKGATRPVTQFTRDLLYLRPGTFVVYDRTSVAGANNDQWLSFHTPTPPSQGQTADSSQRRYDIQVSGATVGSIRTLLPRGAATQVVTLLGGQVSRLETHAPAAGADQDWLTVISAGAPPEQVRLSVNDGNVTTGQMTGVHLLGARNQVVLFTADHVGAALTGAARYLVHQTADADHVLVDMQPGGYSVSATPSGGSLLISVQKGGTYAVSPAGNLSFAVSTAGAVSPSP